MFVPRPGPKSALQSRRARRPWGIGIGLASLLALVLTACGGGGSGTTAQGTPNANAKATSTVTCPSVGQSTLHLVTPNELTIASDTTYAPAEFVDPNNPTQFDGYDMDLVREIARRLCLGPHIVTASFDSIITNISGPALGQQQWDMSISSFSIRSDRLQKVDMLPYFVAGESMLVAKGNPKNIKSITDLCGLEVAVQNGTIELGELQDANGEIKNPDGSYSQNDGGVTQPPVCKDKPIKKLTFDSEEDVINQVINGRAVAAYQDEPVTSYYVSLNPGKVDVGYVTQNSRGTEGIVMRKDNPGLENAVKTALNNMVQDGTYQRIMAAWGQTSLACLPNCPPAS